MGGGEDIAAASTGKRTKLGTMPSIWPPMKAPATEPTARASTNPPCRRSTVKLRSRLYLAKPTSIVGRLTASDRLPASLMSAPNSRTVRVR
jgi:hypothetical protein